MNDLDPLLRDAMASVRRPVDARPSLTDVRRRARRRNRRRTGVVAGALACTGVAATALIVRRDTSSPSAGVAESADGSTLGSVGESTLTPTTLAYVPVSMYPTTVPGLSTRTIDASLVWSALQYLRNDPTAAGFVLPPQDSSSTDQMPTDDVLGCSTDSCRAMFPFVVWHAVALYVGYGGDVWAMQAANPNVDFSVAPVEGVVLQTPYQSEVIPTTINPTSVPITTTTMLADNTTTTAAAFDGIILVDAGAPVGAMDDAYQRLAGYNRTIVPSAGKAAPRTMVMITAPNESVTSMASSIANSLFGVYRLDPYDPTYVEGPITGIAAVVIGPDYWDVVSSVVNITQTTTTTIVGP